MRVTDIGSSQKVLANKCSSVLTSHGRNTRGGGLGSRPNSKTLLERKIGVVKYPSISSNITCGNHLPWELGGREGRKGRRRVGVGRRD